MVPTQHSKVLFYCVGCYSKHASHWRPHITVEWCCFISVQCHLCMNHPENMQNHLFYQCRYSAEGWKSLTYKLLSTEYTHQWEDIVLLRTNHQRSKVELFLLWYVLKPPYIPFGRNEMGENLENCTNQQQVSLNSSITKSKTVSQAWQQARTQSIGTRKAMST